MIACRNEETEGKMKPLLLKQLHRSMNNDNRKTERS